LKLSKRLSENAGTILNSIKVQAKNIDKKLV
jgi:hypothetical protein